MTSKLFHTVVGVGIALGSAACGGATTDDFIEPLAADAGTGGVTASGGAAGSSAGTGGAAGSAGAAGMGTGGAGGAAGAGGGAGVAGQDAGAAGAPPVADAGTDAVVGAFCDNPWPITKAGRVVCGPYDSCQLGEAPWCFGPDGQGSCTITPLECSDGKWQCMGAATPINQPQPPFECP